MDQKRKKSGFFPARVFALIPMEDDNAIILRRGPSSYVGVFRWNIQDDSIEVCQWLAEGRIYEYFSDLSPDGKHFIYSANKNGFGYTAISYAPWIRPLSFWKNVGLMGGGIFLDNKEYVLCNGNHYNEFIDKSLEHISKKLEHGVYHERLIRNQWSIKIKEENTTIYRKQICGNVELEKIFTRGDYQEGKGIFSESHKLVYHDSVEDKPYWEWAEWIENTLYWSEKGCLYEAQLGENNKIGIASLIYDFNPEVYVKREAPYGVGDSEERLPISLGL